VSLLTWACCCLCLFGVLASIVFILGPSLGVSVCGQSFRFLTGCGGGAVDSGCWHWELCHGHCWQHHWVVVQVAVADS